MKIRVLIIPILLLLSFTAISQDFWERIPVPDTFCITSIAVNANGDIFACTNGDYIGGLYRTVDGGNNWEKVFTPENRFGLRSLAISDSGVVYAIGLFEDIQMLKSTDNGQTWSLINIPEYSWNEQIFLQGEDTIFVSQWRNGSGNLLRSVDGGQTWVEVFVAPGVQYVRDMAFGTDGSIYIGLMTYVLDGGGICKSMDGGDSWEFLGLANHQVGSISIDTSNNLLITILSNMSDIYISGFFYYNHFTNEFSPLYTAWKAWGSAINSNNEFFTTYHDGTLHSVDGGLTYYEIIGGDSAASCELLLSKDQYIYAFGQSCNDLFKTVQSTVTGVTDKLVEKSLLEINPNPVDTELFGSIKTTIHDEKGVVIIVNETGNRVLKKEITIENGSFMIDVSHLSKGIYFINLCISGSSYSAKIVKG